ncbi:hypothetical protein TNIN_981 [Trichonephila inaurata madagascariensis]|uniref:Uncharacterized protein n=1 Tax=Trichonephila inaurata madagascariensis TaxID=2747483 RepID=A0A8X6X2X3_9ARAC|nr:hypothetical protein TNIN_981 [Trichonephila inaurata madagascariensis]
MKPLQQIGGIFLQKMKFRSNISFHWKNFIKLLFLFIRSVNSICHLQIKPPHHRRDSTASLCRRYSSSPGLNFAVPKHETVCPLLTAVEVLDACTTAVSSETKGGKDSINNGLPLTS